MWLAVAERHGLRYADRVDVAASPHADFVWRVASDIVSSTTKARLAGCHRHEASDGPFIRYLDTYRTVKVLP